MTTQVSTKVRLVRCPKCRQVLAELPDVLLYQCGGCNTVLQAKNRKLENNQTELTARESDSVAKSQQDNISEEKETRSENHDLISQHEPSVSDEISSSPEVNCCLDQDSPTQAIELKHEEEEETRSQTSAKRDSKFSDHENLHEHEVQENGLRQCAAYRERMKIKYNPLENDENSENCVMDQNEHSIEVDDEIEGLPTFGSSSPNKSVSSNVEDSKSFVSFYLSSPEDECSVQKFTRNFERVSSVDTLGSSPLDRVSSELGVKHGDGTNFTRTGSYYAYDGSESSYDGTDDHISNPSRKIKGSDYIITTERLKRGSLRANDVVNIERETSYWAMNSRAVKSRDIGGNKTRLDKQGVVSNGLRFTSRDVTSCPRTENPSSYRPNLPPAPPRFRSSLEPSSYSQPNKIDLLRTVCELKDQLSRMHFPTDGRFPLDEKFAPYHYNPRGYDSPPHQGWSEQHNVPRMAFSGEAAHYRHQVNCSCLRCCPRDWRYSAQLPSNCMNCRNGHCTVPTEHYTSSELSLHGCETKFENINTAKRHLRPVTGGAPFVTCYYCSEVLQLPADFLLFKKRYHQLMCNACKKVLKFSVFNGTHLVPYGNDISAPVPSVADSCNDTPARRNLEPVSCSDDYGQSFGQSCSTSFDKSEKNYNRSSNEPVEDRKMKSILGDPVESVEPVGPSSKIPKWRKTSSEIESSNSPLHRLMGYSSPSQVLKK